MSDLYSGLMNADLRKGQNGEEFWGLFNSLDHPGPPSTDFLKLQIAELQNLENTNQKYTEANKFLQMAQQRLGQQPTVEDAITDQVYNRIVELLNAGLRGSMVNPYRNIKAKGIDPAVVEENTKGEIAKVLDELTSLLVQIKASPEITAQMVDTLERRLKTFDWNTPTPHSYIMEKADLIEALMVDRMNQHPGLRAVVTGAWTDASGKQLIEDAFAFSTQNMSIPFPGGKLNYTIKTSKGSEAKSATSIQDFLSQIDQLNGTKFTVSLTNELYKALQEGAAIAGQAKSGLAGQNILNKNARNALSLEQVKFNPMALWHLYQLDLETKTDYFKPVGQQSSETLEALANYHLSLSIGETALSKNQVYLTADGFVTASQWMEKYQKYLVFTPGVTSVGPDFLTKTRPYYFTE